MSSKLRYYLRGLGIGILVTAGILIISDKVNNSSQMTDAQVIARATELGMVDASSYSLTDAVSAEAGQNSSDDADSTADENLKSEDETAQDADNDEDPADDSAPDADDDTDPGDEAAQNPDNDEDPADDSAPDADDDIDPGDEAAQNPDNDKDPTDESTPDDGDGQEPLKNTGETVSFTIPSGSGSERVASIIEAAGLIEDANDFNLYMEKNGYSRKIRTGTYTMTIGSTYEEICKAIAG